MTGPLYPPDDTAAPTPNAPPGPDPEDPGNTGYAPSVFMADYTFPPGGSVQIPPLPRSDGGLIQSVKTATVLALRDALSGVSLADKTQSIKVSLEYPLQEIDYPSIWVQFSVNKLNRSGVGHEMQIQLEGGGWGFIQEWTFVGRITISILALKNIDRDRLSDAIISQLAFARPPELPLSRPQADTKQNRTLITALDENPYVAMTLQLDTLIPGGQQATPGTPFKDDILTYEDSWSFDMVGQFNQQFSNDGMYTLARIDPNYNVSATGQPLNTAQWLPPVQPAGTSPFNLSGQTNAGNVNYPAL